MRFYEKKIKYIAPCILGWGIQKWSQIWNRTKLWRRPNKVSSSNRWAIKMYERLLLVVLSDRWDAKSCIRGQNPVPYYRSSLDFWAIQGNHFGPFLTFQDLTLVIYCPILVIWGPICLTCLRSLLPLKEVEMSSTQEIFSSLKRPDRYYIEIITLIF